MRRPLGGGASGGGESGGNLRCCDGGLGLDACLLRRSGLLGSSLLGGARSAGEDVGQLKSSRGIAATAKVTARGALAATSSFTLMMADAPMLFLAL